MENKLTKHQQVAIADTVRQMAEIYWHRVYGELWGSLERDVDNLLGSVQSLIDTDLIEELFVEQIFNDYTSQSFRQLHNKIEQSRRTQ